MSAGNYSVETLIIENGKSVKGTLTLFIDEYVFGNERITVNWENVTCGRGTVKIKGFLRSVEKPYIEFTYAGEKSRQFILENGQAEVLVQKVSEFAEEKRRQEERERQIREEARRKTEAEYQKKQDELRKTKEDAERIKQEQFLQKHAEKKIRMQREVEACKNKPELQLIMVEGLSKKAASAFLDNPYRILGISCLATNEEANNALDKLKKLARLKALDAYQTPFDISGIAKPSRDLSVAQNALSLLKDKSHKFFWFSESDSCVAWQDGKYRIELSRDGEEYGTYDLFLANYMYAVICDPDFQVSETWKRVLNFYCYICKDSGCSLLRSRFNERELEKLSNSELLNNFRKNIFSPIFALCERDDLDALIRLHKYIKACENRLLEGLSRNVLSKLVSWFTEKEASLFSYLSMVSGSEEQISDFVGKDILNRGEAYCRVVEPVLEIVLRDFRGDAVRYDMIKESYRHATYQLMYELNKCPDKSSAIIFANKCYSYCSADDKKRIQNTFGEANIKSIDWNTPHTSWDAKGDDYYYGRGQASDYTQALYWYHKAAEAGNMYSMNSIGICYQKGNGVPQDDSMAVSWFKKAAEAGNPQGAYNLAECYYAGTGIKRDIDSALKNWADAAKLGHPSAGQRREEVFSEVQIQRRNHRARNHICHDLGFQMTTGPSIMVEVTINQSANVYLVNMQGYQNYLNGNEFTYHGGYAAGSPYRIRIPSSNHWYVIVDNGDEPITGIKSSAKVKNA